MSVDDVHLYYISDGTTTYCESVKTTDTEANLIETTLPVTCDIILANPNTVVKSTNPIYTPSGRMNNNLSDLNIDNLMLYDGYSFHCDVPSYSIHSGSYMRSMPANQWGTVILPYKVYSNEYIQFYDLKSVTASRMHFEEVAQVPANTPVVFQRLQSSNEKVSFPSTKSNAVGTEEEQSQSLTNAPDWTAYGNYDATKYLGSDERAYYIAEDKFWLSEGSLEVKPFRSYFTYQGDKMISDRLDINGDEPTGIESISTPLHPSDNVFYNLAGQRVSHPTRGIYIVNGKKVYIK